MIEAVAFVGMFLGVISRTALPYLYKVQGGANISWDNRYLASAIASLILCTITVALVFPAFTIPEGSVVAAFFVAYVFGFGINSTVNEIDKWTIRDRSKQ